MLNYKNIIVLLIFNILSFSSIFSQSQINFESISISDGLTDNSINSINQDGYGYLWICTKNGLNKYDGYKITNYRNEPLDTNSLLGNIVFFTYVDTKKNLWVCTDEALNKYNYASDSFERFIYKQQDQRPFFNSAISIVEDKKNTFWIAKPYNGLLKFNSIKNSFKEVKFKYSNYDHNGHTFISIVKDRYNNLWVNTQDSGRHLIRISPDRDSLVDYTHLEDKNIPRNNLLSVYHVIDEEGNFWIFSVNGYAYKYDRTKDDFEEQFYIPGANLLHLHIEKDIIWAATANQGLFKYYRKSNTYDRYYKDLNNKNSLRSNITQFVYRDRSGVFWVGTRNAGLNKFDTFREPIANYTLPVTSDKPQDIRALSVSDDKNIIWIGSENGVYKFNNSKKQFSKIKSNVLENSEINSIYQDSRNNVWISASGKGVYKFNRDFKSSIEYNNNKYGKHHLPSNFINDINEDKTGNIWLSSNYGLFKVDTNGVILNSYRTMDSTYHKVIMKIVDSLFLKNADFEISGVKNNQNIKKSFKLKNATTFAVVSLGEVFALNGRMLYDYGWLEDSEGNLIWGKDSLNTMHCGGDLKNRMQVSVIKLNAGSYNLYYNSDDSHSAEGWNASPPKWETKWGIHLYNIGKKDAELISSNLQKKVKGNNLLSDNITTSIEDSEGRIWMATADQGFAILNKDNSIITFSPDSKSNYKIPFVQVNTFLEDEFGYMWVGAVGGLIQVNKNDFTIKVISPKEGLPSSYIVDMAKDLNNNIWLSTLRGLIKFSPGYNDKIPIFISYSLKDGLQGFEFYKNAAITTENGELFFGGKQGMNAFYPGQINSNPPEIIFTDVSIFHKSLKPGDGIVPVNKSIADLKTLELSYNQNMISFNFIGFHYSNSKKIQYAYILDGLDKDWIRSNTRSAIYTNLEPGEYIFKVKAANSDGVWNDVGRSLLITINPPWFANVYAYILYGVILFVFVFIVDKWNKEKIIKREREKAVIDQAELRAEAAELQAKAAEAQARAMQIENNRKTKELEEARLLQLAMLPKELPQVDGLDIAVYMKTATEVGGDYYDFYLDSKNNLTVAVGDATGHGLNAGTMVTATKSLFSAFAGEEDIVATLKHMAKVIKNMRFRMLAMCLTLLKISDKKISITSAGMPPTYLYREGSGEIEEILLKGMPLGAIVNFPYSIANYKLDTGDTLIMMSDGFPELFNAKGEMLGYDEVQTVLKKFLPNSAEKIIEELVKYSNNWAEGEEQHDDITFVVIKVK